jgi:hypothetical protein
MPDALLVVNASPLIFLGNAGHLELLHTLGASRIIVPEPVVGSHVNPLTVSHAPSREVAMRFSHWSVARTRAAG